ncbi:MAG: hydroxymethylbilane synthase [Aggregatilineales bacterium]
MTTQRLIIGTRKSQLAVWQAEYVADQLRALHPGLEVTLRFVITQGDRITDKPLPEIGGKGLFTAELEAELANGDIQLAVHSLKDLPTDLDAAFVIGAIPIRASPYDVLISRSGKKLVDLPSGATVGTSSLRRIAQIKAARPDLQTATLRGNVPTRINKALASDSPYDAIVLAQAGLDRLGLADKITETLAPLILLPAPAQGALGVQCRADDTETLALLASLDHLPTRLEVTAERAFLQALDSGCRLPVAALAEFDGTTLRMAGRVLSADGKQVISVREALTPNPSPAGGRGELEQAVELGFRLAQAALEQGAGALLAVVEERLP